MNIIDVIFAPRTVYAICGITGKETQCVDLDDGDFISIDYWDNYVPSAELYS